MPTNPAQAGPDGPRTERLVGGLMATPRTVKRQAENAAELQKQYIESKQAAPDAETPPADAETGGQQGVSSPEKPDPSGSEPAQKTGTEPSTETKRDAESAGGPSEADDPATYWRNRWATVNGKYQAEVPRLNRRVKELEAELKEYESTVQHLRQQLTERPSQGDQSRASEDERAELGDLATHFERRDQRIAHLEEKLREEHEARERERQERQQKDEETAKEADAKFFTGLAQEHPDWEQINQRSDWIAWLQEPDPDTGFTRQEMLNRAHANGDDKRASRIFTAFKAWAGLSEPAADSPGKPDRERKVQPDTHAGDGASPDQHEKRIWTNADIQAFYKRKQAYAQRYGPNTPIPDELAAIEKEIEAAGREGRIR